MWLDFVREFMISKPRIVAPLILSNASDNRPYIKVDILGQEVVALLDSGANVSVIGSKGSHYLSLFGLCLQVSSLKSIKMADGGYQYVRGYVELPIVVEGIVHLLRVLVVPTVDHSLILGMDFCSMFGVRVDFSEGIWDINCEGGNMKVFDSVPHLAAVNFIKDVMSLDRVEREQLD